MTVHIDHLVVERNDDGSFHIRGIYENSLSEHLLKFEIVYMLIIFLTRTFYILFYIYVHM